jgi:ABC-type transporter Mla subunit MlaD
MLSRTADHLFWMSRYTERAEKAAAGGLSPQDRVRGSLPAHAKESAC